MEMYTCMVLTFVATSCKKYLLNSRLELELITTQAEPCGWVRVGGAHLSCWINRGTGVLTVHQASQLISRTPSISNCTSFDFFYYKFDYSSYSKIYIKYYFFLLWVALSIQDLQKWIKFDNLYITFWIRLVVKLWVKKSNQLQFEMEVVPHLNYTGTNFQKDLMCLT